MNGIYSVVTAESVLPLHAIQQAIEQINDLPDGIQLVGGVGLTRHAHGAENEYDTGWHDTYIAAQAILTPEPRPIGVVYTDEDAEKIFPQF